jgi:outer membrane protein assembly factor BamB
MKLSRSKTATLIALFLMFAIAISLVALPDATAQPTCDTYAYLGVLPNPVGVGQEVLLHVGITKELNLAYMGWEGLSVTIKRPDGRTDTITDIRTDSTGGTGRNYKPDIAGNYTLQSHFPEQVTTATKVAGGFFTARLADGTVMLESYSEEVILVVQEDPISYYPANPLPTEYWRRPIDPHLREWSAVGGSWTEAYVENLIAPGSDDAPETAHVLWVKQYTQAGLVGQNIDGQPHSFEIGDAYEGKFANRFIVAGKLYFDKYASPDPYHEIVCVDLHTGEQLWSRVLLNNLTISFAQLMYWDTYDYHGVYDYLWATANAGTYPLLGLINSTVHGTAWCAFDPMTGDFVWALYGMPSGTRVMGPKGEILIYNVNRAGGYMTLWNSSACTSLRADSNFGTMGYGQWRAMGKVHNATRTVPVTPDAPFGLNGYTWNVSIPTNLPGSAAVTTTKIFPVDRVIGATISYDAVNMWGLNLDPNNGVIGRELFRNTWTPPNYWKEGSLTVNGSAAGWTDWSQEDYVAVMWIRESREHFGFSLENGKYLWGPTEPQYYFDSVEDSPADVRNIAYGKLYSASTSGIVYCYDVKTGDRLWTYEATDPYHEYLFANTWWMKPVAIADGKIYCGTTEHSPIDPRPRGGPFVCLNATTGEVIWKVEGMFRQTRWGGRGLMGDSIIATQDTYDQRIWAIGKGPSATTVTAGPKVSVHGSSILVEGMVTDISPGTADAALKMRFPNGVPAVADENISAWMQYVYKQFAKPADVVGVEVVISVLDPNNNCYEVARATSNVNGFFSADFEPLVPGKYTVIAEFAGSKAYYGSFAETSLLVEEAPAATPPPTPEPESPADLYFLPMSIGLLVAIIVVGAVLFLLLRKR